MAHPRIISLAKETYNTTVSISSIFIEQLKENHYISI